MRITNGILSRQATTGFQAQMRALDEARRQATSGLRVERPSDDPVANAGIMEASSSLRALEQYKRNLQVGQSRLAIEDSTLEQVGNVLARGKELALSQASDTASAQTRLAAQQELNKLVDFVTDLGNAKLAGAYVFGGQYADSAPFTGTVHDPARPPSGAMMLEIGPGLFVEANHDAQEIFIDTDAVDALKALSSALGANDTTAITTAMGRVDAAFQNTQELVGELGARMNQMDVTISNLDTLEVTLQTFRSELSDADIAEAVTNLVNRQGSLEAAMLANSRILNLTLTDYLR